MAEENRNKEEGKFPGKKNQPPVKIAAVQFKKKIFLNSIIKKRF